MRDVRSSRGAGPGRATVWRRPSGRGPSLGAERIAVIGGGPAGAFFAYFVFRFARQAGLEVQVDVFEPRDFAIPGPRGCNMCGGLIPGSLVRELQGEGITLPPSVIQNEIDRYTLWTDAGTVHVTAPDPQRPAVSVYRGAGPRNPQGATALGLDAFLLDIVQREGARIVRERITRVAWNEGRPQITVAGAAQVYDLIVVAIGATLAPGRLLDELGLSAGRPTTTSAYIAEFPAPDTAVTTTMDVLLLDIDGVDAVGVIPKGRHATMCVVGSSIDRSVIERLFAHPLLNRPNSPARGDPQLVCHCSPKLNVYAAPVPFRDRVVLVGDSGVTRLYKDGLGSALRTSRAAARTVVSDGVSADAFRRGYWPTYRAIAHDNRYGAIVFWMIRKLRGSAVLLRASLDAVVAEQRSPRGSQRLDGVLWDLFTGGSTYGSVLRRICDPRSVWRVGVELARSVYGRRSRVAPSGRRGRAGPSALPMRTLRPERDPVALTTDHLAKDSAEAADGPRSRREVSTRRAGRA